VPPLFGIFGTKRHCSQFRENLGWFSANAAGIFAIVANVTNSGIIAGTIGIQSNAASSVVNAGSINRHRRHAIQFGGGAEYADVAAGLAHRRRDQHGGGADVVRFVAGPDISWLVTLQNFTGTINGSGGAPFRHQRQQIATIDPTAFALTDRTLMDFTGAVSSLINSRFGEMAPVGSLRPGTAFAPQSGVSMLAGSAFDSIPRSRAPMPRPANPLIGKAPAMVDRQGNAVWAKGFIGERVQQGDGRPCGQQTSTPVARSQSTLRSGRNLRLGAFLGAGFGRLAVDLGSQGVDTDFLFGGVYGRFDWAAQFFDFAVSAGPYQKLELAPGGQQLGTCRLEYALASYNGWYVSPEAAFGHRSGSAMAFRSPRSPACATSRVSMTATRAWLGGEPHRRQPDHSGPRGAARAQCQTRPTSIAVTIP